MSATEARHRVSRKPLAHLALALSAAGLFAAACGGNSAQVGSQTTVANSATAPATGADLTISAHKGSLGTFLTTSAGKSLYLFAGDTSSKSTCYGACATHWPPLTGSAAQTSGAANSAMTGTTKRTDGTTQITYGGHPLYTYVGDNSPGDTTGQGVNLDGGKWWLVDTQGKQIGGSGYSTGYGR
jgi:predicted lipoprotein with Yx(FWY)xxD motif